MTEGLRGALEVSGTVATLVLLAPFAALAAVMWRALREDAPKDHHEPVAATAFGVAKLPPQADETAIRERPVATLVRDDDVGLAMVYLVKAREAVSAGDVHAATGLLRQSIGHAHQEGNVSVHADARLDLAEIAREAGDLTTACEHWQIARKLFIDNSRKDRLAEADALMLRHGCPTDWVLTDF